MVLIDEAGVRRCIGEAGSRPDQPADGVQPPHDEVTVGTCAKDRGELARQRKPIETCNWLRDRWSALGTWQKLNVASFLAGRLAGSDPDLVGVPYRDASVP